MFSNKNLNLLLKSLIDSDFLLMEKASSTSTRAVKNVIKTKMSSTINLNPLELIKDLKQFVRLLQYAQKQKLSILHLVVENKQYLELLQTFFKESRIKMPIEISESLPTRTLSSKTTQVLLLLNFPLDNKATFFRRLIDKNIFLINKINAKIEKNNYGTYKIYNDLTDFKKIIFLLAVIDQILNNKKVFNKDALYK